VTDRPILFSAPMIRALLDGRKTQTRRIIKRQPALDACAVFGPAHLLLPGNVDLARFAVGDRLWVKETWRSEARFDTVKPVALPRSALVSFDADYRDEPNDGCRGRTRVSIHMPRWASRLTLTVTGVRVQRLQEISEADAAAEGAAHAYGQPFHSDGALTDRRRFECLWKEINGPDSWAANPWIVALTFTVERRNIDAARAA
jgi:hypothetical protein